MSKKYDKFLLVYKNINEIILQYWLYVYQRP